MNVVLRELKAHLRSISLWIVGLAFLIVGGMAKYNGFETSGQSVNEMIEVMPKSIQVVFGMNAIDLSTLIGFYTVLFSYVLMVGAIHAAILGANLISKEERDKTAEFLLVKPVSRNRLIAAKLTAGMIYIIVFLIVTFLISFIMFVQYDHGMDLLEDLLTLMLGLFILQLVFFSIGAAVAAASKRPKSAVAVTTGFLLLTYIFSVVSSLSEKLEFLKFISPFAYVEAKELLFGAGFQPMFVTLALGIIMCSVLLTFRIYHKKDIKI